jgi:DNA-3-methyladenine glycosylase II
MTPEYWNRAKRALSRRDPVMGAIIRGCPGVALVHRGEPFTTLARAIVGQQISVKAAQTVWERINRALPEFTPAAVTRHGAARLARCGLSRRKAEYFVDLARHFRDGLLQLDGWAGMDDEAVIRDLVQVRGIGRWTSEMFLMFDLLRPDVLPLDDIGLQRAVSVHYFDGAPAAMAEIRELAEMWSPWRSVATWYLWRSLDPVPVEY